MLLAKTDTPSVAFILAGGFHQDKGGYVVDGRGCTLTKVKADALCQMVDAGYKPPSGQHTMRPLKSDSLRYTPKNLSMLCNTRDGYSRLRHSASYLPVE